MNIGQFYTLALVTSKFETNGSRSIQIKTNHSNWNEIKKQMILERNQNQQKEQEKKQNEQSGKSSYQIKQQQQQEKKQFKDSMLHVKQKISIENNQNSKNNSDCIDSLTLHYVLLDGMTSNFREYLALHDLGTKIKLLPEILATVQEEVFVDTTPVGTPNDW